MDDFLTSDGVRVRLTPGIQIRNNSIRVWFYYQDQRCFETIGAGTALSDIQKATGKLAVIKEEIAKGTFDYRHWFPNSKRALSLSGSEHGSRPKITLAEMMAQVSEKAEATLAPATLKGERSHAARILAYFGKTTPVRNIGENSVDGFITYLRTKKKLRPKTINNNLNTLRRVLNAAYDQKVLPEKVRISGYKTSETLPADKPDPLTSEELAILERYDGRYNRHRDMLLFAAFSGLSLSEWKGLAWDDIEAGRDVWRITVERSLVNGQYKTPKTSSRRRRLELSHKARTYLQRWRERTAVMAPMDTTVLVFESRADDKRTKVPKTIQLRPVFLSERSKTLFTDTAAQRALDSLFKDAGVRRRSCNQMRHTYASQLLTRGAPLEFIARQMGHVDTAMVRKHYATWIDRDAVGRDAEMLNRLFGS